MKKLLPLVLLVSVAHVSFVSAQEFSRKFGKPTDHELQMTNYERDTSAVAVYLYEMTNVRYDYLPGIHTTPFKQFRNYSVKIKVLKPEGVSLADVEIPYYFTSNSKEYVSGITAVAYNKVNGKTVKTPVKSKEMFTEQLSDKRYVRKFSIPEVRVGTVIEYKYTVTSDFFWDIDPIRVQHEHPVIYSFAEVATPQYFKFNVNASGLHPVVIKTSRGNSNTAYYDDVRTCVALDVPGLEDEPHVWNVDDFRAKVDFELQAIDFPGVMYKSYATTWQSVNENLEKSDFSSNLKMSNPLKEEVAAITASETDESTRIRSILRLVTSRMSWNGTYSIWGTGIRQKLRNGAGNSAEINFVLNSALRDAGFKTTPVLLNPHQYGRLPYGNPSMDNIRAFIIRVDLSNGRTVFVDGTNPDNDLNLIPSAYMVDRARVYGDHSMDGWVDLTSLSPNTQSVILNGSVDQDGKLTGNMSCMVQNTLARMLKSSYRQFHSEDAYIEKLETENGMEISSYEISDLQEPIVTERLEFSLKNDESGEYIYLKATGIPFMTKNILTQQERKLPIEFSYPAQYNLIARIAIPEDYEIEEVPSPVRMSACDNGVSYVYQISVENRIITVNLQYSQDRVIFTQTEYPDLHTFWSLMIEKNNSSIILKRT